MKDKRFPSNPLAGLNKRRVDVDRRRRRRSLTMEEVGRLVVAAEKGRRVDGVPGRVRAMAYVLAAYLGLRKGEISQLRRGDVDFENNSLRVRASVSKNRREAHLPLHPELVGRLRQYLDQQGSGTSRHRSFPWAEKIRRS